MMSRCVKKKKDFEKLENCDDEVSSNGEEEVLPLEMTHLTPALVEEAKTKLHETEAVKQKALVDLRRAIEAEKNLVCPTDDLFLLTFLRSRKFSVKKAFKLIQNYWKFRRDYNDIYSGIDVEQCIQLLRHNFIGLLKHRDKNGCVIFVGKIGLWDPDVDSYENIFRIISAILVYTQEHEATQIAGFRAIIDFRGMTWKQFKYFTPANLLLLVRSTQFCYPARYKGVHLLCENTAINFLWPLVYPFLTPKLKKRILFHGEDFKALQQYIHPSVLPEEFGGKAKPFSNEAMMDIIHSRVSIVTAQLNYGYKD